MTIHAKKINSVHLEPTGQPYLTTASSDNTVRVWGLRKTSSSSAAFTRPLAELRHGRSCHSAFWDPTGTGRIATVSFDDTVRIFGQSLRGAGYVEEVTTRHNNNTGRYIVPFKPRWSPAGDAIVVGCMQRGFDVIDAGSGEITCNVTGEWLTAIPARTNFHPWR